MSRLFQDELSYLKDSGRDFARLNPKLARYLADTSTDPDVERLLEGFAFLTSRVREKIDDEMSEFTISVIKLLWPNFLRPFPSTTMMKFTPADRVITERHILPKGSAILSNSIRGQQCVFQTISDCPIYPLEIENVALERSRDSSKIRIDFKTLSGLPLSQINLKDLRLTLCGDMPVRQMLYLWLGRYLKKISIVFKNGKRKSISKNNIAPIGFASEESILPHQNNAFDGHRLLQEYFVFPDKFYGYDLLKLGAAFENTEESDFSLEIDFERAVPSDMRLKTDNIKLYCAPAVNLFETDAEPLIIKHTKTHYRVRPLGFDTDHIEIFSIDAIKGQRASDDKEHFLIERNYPAFESFNHEVGFNQLAEQVFFYSRPRQSLRTNGFEYDVSFVLHNSEPAVPSEEVVSIDITCFNSDLCQELAVGDICIPTEKAPVFVSYSNITRPTEPIYPPLDGTLNWNLISNLSLNYMSLLSHDALAAMLSIYDYQSLTNRQAERAAKQRINGIVDLKTKPIDLLFKGLPVRGLKSIMQINESAFYTEGEMYLFAAVLAEFFTLYATVNSFHELEVHGLENGEIYQWPAKIGRQPLI
ncbi:MULTISPECIES: type VI secretion system baseplate subunit TssF [unclassified Bartonella]|uniref:type VI secretion system baseplate subunit TssF n=1 Tax=unclassified Bartonella TaxID=2645622 RepID=UPI0021C99880|nr:MULTISPECIES: type VI secretion system baseplate subunit TssF [unclassified Bartonella]UXN05085.1 type VI secretion system baseplate subunit TssF [Bartonella sp. HY406]UXN08094.1 type VI secretion system baseplate subunit TssF [Bartonella sp. HY761]